MEEDGGGQPRHECRVLDRIPRPESSPSELHIGPVGPGDHSDREEAPRYEQPAPRGPEPWRAQVTSDHTRHRGGKGHYRGRQAQVQDRRVIDHRRVLQQCQQALAIHGGDVEAVEGVDQKSRERQSQERNSSTHGTRRPSPEAKPRHCGGDRRIEEHRAFHTAPKCRQAVGPGCRSAGDLGHICQGEVVRDKAKREDDRGRGGQSRSDTERLGEPRDRSQGGEPNRAPQQDRPDQCELHRQTVPKRSPWR